MTRTFQSRRHKRQRRMPPMWRPAFEAWQRRDEARRVALPERPADPVAGECLFSWPLTSRSGWTVEVRLLVPASVGRNRPRSDQFDLEIDGAIALRRKGLTAVMEHLRTEVFPHQLTRLERYRADQAAEAVWSD